MFETIFIESRVKDLPQTQKLQAQFPKARIQHIAHIDDIFGRVKKPYLQKNESLNLFIGIKDGELVKEAPDAYGLGSEKHFYFVHAYNCIYECQYCYLQGYFNSPDIVLFLNHEEISNKMQELVDKHQNPWFHAGEYSDSLALSHLTNEIPHYFSFFKRNSKAKLELRTKSANIKELLSLEPLDNVYISFSLSSTESASSYDKKCASIKARLHSIKKLYEHGYKIGLHLDPVIYEENFIQNYQTLIAQLKEHIPLREVAYISLGVVRFTKDVFKEVQHNYPDSKIALDSYVKSFDNKVRYNRPMRMWILNSLKDMLIGSGAQEDRIYLCME